MLVFKTNKVANTLCIFGWILTVISAFYAVFAFLNDPLIGIAFLAAAALGLLLVGVAELIELIFKIGKFEPENKEIPEFFDESKNDK